MRRIVTLLTAIAALAAAGCGGSKPAPPLVVGAVDDAAKWAPDPDRAMAAAHEAGLDVIVLSAVWSTDATVERDLPPLRRAVRAAVRQTRRADPRRLPAQRIHAGVARQPHSLRNVRREPGRRLPAVHQVVVGNEPNLNLFWAPQFGTDGSDAAAGLVRGAARRDLRRAQGASVASRGDRRRPRTSRRRRPVGLPADPFADGVHP